MVNSLHYLQYRAGMAEPVTQTSRGERAALRRYASGRRRLAEIGVFHGVNTRVFREVMAPDGVLLAIDPFPRTLFGIRGYGWARRIAHREVSRSTSGQVLWVEDMGKNTPARQDAARLLPVDFLFIDGDHSWEGLQGDWESWSSHIAPEGIVALHDSAACHGAGSERFTNEVILQDTRYKKLECVETLTVLRRVA